MRFGIRAENERGVVRDVQPLVRVRDPGIGALGAAHEVTELRTCRGPQPKRTVDVEPGPVVGARVGDLVEVVEGARVHLARLRADDGRPVARGQRITKDRNVQPALRVGADRLGLAEPEEPQSPVDRDVALLAGEHANGRAA